MSPDTAFFLVNSYTWKVSNMLIGTSQLIKKCCLSTVLITCQGKRDRFSLGDRVPNPVLTIITGLSKLSNARMGNWLMPFALFLRFCHRFDPNDLNLCSFCQPQCQLISTQHKLYRISHRSGFTKGHLCPWCKPHVQKMMSQLPLATNTDNSATFSSL